MDLEDINIPFHYDLDPGGAPKYLTHRARTVQVLAGLGLSLADISNALSLDPKTVAAEFKAELQSGAALANISVAHVAYKMATDGEHSEMTRFWLKTRAGWVEKQIVEHTGKDGNPIEIEISAKQKLMQLIQSEE